jgi:hypothetical protein
MLIIDNDRVSVWDSRLTAGQRGPDTPDDADKIIMFIDGGDFEMTTPLGAIIRLPTQPGQAMFIPKVSPLPVLASEGRFQVAIVALKDAPSPSDLGNKPLPSPHPGSTRMIATPRATVWRHYDLSAAVGKDPLNASALAKGRHKTDPENYRGLGYRTDAKERGRLTELFYAQAEDGSGIAKAKIDVAIAKYHAKQAALEVQKLQAKPNG